ncbi:glycoside hydrolase family 32 protein [Haloarcula sp. S1CR25-12]|uniref:Glycoside hydrolase family 32 protein n=1 Tax=Haloarcula saliterrae TaxID=2950534 RepID=A0ABU2FGI4_9EURY|nr:glycoside hydrolase family 32 protein [Haloarcula sp. S1CR25-12]MDS0261372.1 glycoside hydrolase family 32 protein [Haloarcula sp. S1CR25-12]
MATDKTDTEPFRPAFHFAPTEGWMNDPNGMVYHDGTYHLFYQAGADRRRWDHARSDDLCTWDERGCKVPDDGVQAFSGGAVVDSDDTAGFGPDSIVAMYSGHHDDEREDQRVAYSTDGGDTVSMYPDNPVIPSDEGDFRDPNPLWYEADDAWRMVVARVHPAPDRPRGIEIYESPNLTDWTYLDTYESGDQSWECPSLYELPVAGTDERRWVLTVSVEWDHVEHHVGRFDGESFVADRRVRADHGFDFYGAQTWSNAPEGPGLGLAWMSHWDYAKSLPTTEWTGAQSFPRELALTRTDDGVALRQSPAPALESLRGTTLATVSDESITPDHDPLAAEGVAGLTLELRATVDPGSARQVTLGVRDSADQRTEIVYDAPGERLAVDRSESGAFFHDDHTVAEGPLPLRADGTITLQVLVDRSSVEVFGNGGCYANTNLVFPDPASDGVSLSATGGEATLVSFEAVELSVD